MRCELRTRQTDAFVMVWKKEGNPHLLRTHTRLTGSGVDTGTEMLTKIKKDSEM